MKKIAIVAASVSAAALLGGFGASLAYADPTPSPSTSSSVKPKLDPAEKAARKAARPFGGVGHGEFQFQVGLVEKVGGGSITVKSKDDFTVTYVVKDTTKVFLVPKKEDRRPGTIADVKTGERVRVVATKDGDTELAYRIVDRGAPKKK